MKACAHGWLLILLSACLSGKAAETPPGSPPEEQPPRTADVSARAASATSSPVAAPPAYYQRQPVFYIPFNVSQVAATPTDAVLFVSADAGAKWDTYARQPAAEKSFLFRAARDGEYWFASRMIPAGTAVPEGLALSAELRIIVDTAEPRLRLDARVDASGEVVAVWEAIDEFLLADTVTLQYQMGLGQPWKSVALDRSSAAAEQTLLRGETRWRPERSAAWTSVKLEAKDCAGNFNEVTRRLFSLTSPFGSPPVAAPPAEVPPDPFAAARLTAPPAEQRPVEVPPPPKEPVQPLVSSGAERPAESSPAAAPDPSNSRGSTGAEELAARSPQPPAETVWPSDDQADSPYPSGRFQPATSPIGPPVAQQVNTSNARTQSDTDPPNADAAAEDPADSTSRWGLPAGERPRMTRSRRFNLDYSIDAVGPSGVEKVELWKTENGGQNWELWLLDEDRLSPLTVEVPREGVYGFRVVIVGTNGLASPAPRPGDPADLWVGVDTTAPAVEITSAAYGADSYAGQLDIRWTASDQHLGPRPVTLAFSAASEGPWTTIASGLPNTGQYYWRVDSRMPEQFYLKIEVRDEAGNITSVPLDQPIQSAGLIPRGRIRGFVPTEN